MPTSTRIFSDASRWGLLGAIFFAPWAYGATRPWAIDWLCQWLAVVLGFRVVALFLPRGGSRGGVPGLLLGTMGVLLVQGWWMTLNAKALMDPTMAIFGPLQPLAPHLPGAADAALAISWTIRLSLMLGVVLLVAEMAHDSVWRVRIWHALALAGGSIAALGVLQRAAAAETILWEDKAIRGDESYTKSFFATFYYHANAGAFLNLGFPLAIALTLKSFARPTLAWQHGLIVGNAVIYLLAILLNTSRAAQAIGLMLFLAMLIWPARKLLAFAWEKQRRAVLAGAIIVAAAFAATVFGIGLDKQFERWRDTQAQLAGDGLLHTRLLAQQAALTGLPDAGWFGFGPGCFQVMFPFYTGYLGDQISGFWRFLHADYLQTVFEWGRLGAGAWAVVFFGGLIRGLLKERAQRQERSSQNLYLLPACLLALTGVALHALIDFPLQIASIQLYVAVLLGLCWGWGEVTRSSRRRRKSDEPGETPIA
ncbi:MAG: O-antigen ligase family protein [Verrucomicrobia bacterium]|nr:O-antigen ligase family protein [Verrucomicrobiota bacterium]